MARRCLILVLCAIIAMVTWSCDAEKVTPPHPEEIIQRPQEKDDVLHNLEAAYNERNTVEYEKLLDGNFVFVFSLAEYRAGEVPRLWGEASEIDANRKLMDPNLDGGQRVISIDLSLDYTKDGWTEEAPNSSHPDETWYNKTVDYNLVVKTADSWEHRALDKSARIAIRQDPSTGQWRIVEWRDAPGATTALSPRGSMVEETTWGRLKSLYCDEPFEDLTCMEDVLRNLELTYDQRNYAEYEELIDENFVFIFSDEDFSAGQTPRLWDRSGELDANQNLLDPNPRGPYRAVYINLRLDYPPASWTEQPPNRDHPGESWYTKTVDYDLIVRTADSWEFRAFSLSAQFTIRYDEPPGRWRIVLWRDDVGSAMELAPGETTVKETTWGMIKAQYR